MAPGSNLYKIFFLFHPYHICLFLCFSVSASLGPCKLQGEDNVIPLTGTTGRLLSPLYPKIYPPNMTCTWMIKVPTGKFVKLRISSFFLERFWFPEMILWARIFFVFKWSSPLGSISLSKWEISERHWVQCSFWSCQLMWVVLLWSSPINLWWDESRHELEVNR